MFGEAAGGGKGGIIIAIPKSTHTKTEFLSSGEIAVQLRVFGPLRKQALLPSARYERRVGVSLVRAAWERRPEGPAYLLSSVTLLYLAGLCAF